MRSRQAAAVLYPCSGASTGFGPRESAAGPIQLLTLHGGPSFGHEYFACVEDFLPEAGVEFCYYDQLECHYSDQPNHRRNGGGREALGLTRFYLYGHSWGGLLAIEYALKYPAGLKGLVISNMTASIASYEAYANTLRATLPVDIRAVLDKYEASGEYHAPEYQQAMVAHVYARHLCRLDPWPEPAECALRLKHFNERIYNYLQGPNEFVVTGRFKNWDRWKDVSKINVPALLIGGEHDTMNPDDVRKEGLLIPQSRTHICPHGSHLSFYDDQEDYMHALIGFLKDVDAGHCAPDRRAGSALE